MLQIRSSSLIRFILGLLIVVLGMFTFCVNPVWAGLNDDRYDGNVFVLYAGNGSLVPPRLTLTETRGREMPALIVFYADDSKDCKRFAPMVSELQSYYGKVVSIIPVAVDSIPTKNRYQPDEVGYYYDGKIPQTVILNQKGKVVFNEIGQAKFEAMDDTLRKIFDLPKRDQSVGIKERREFNEYSSEFSQ